MMISAGCVLKTMGNCLHDNNYHYVNLTDRYQKNFTVAANCIHCMNVIYNSIPLSLHNAFTKLSDTNNRLDFTIENGEETCKIIRFFNGLQQKKMLEVPFGEYTTGHEKRGVE